MNKPKVYIVAGSPAYIRMFEAEGWEVVLDPSEADLLQFCGGADVSPSLYDHVQHQATGIDYARDKVEGDFFYKWEGKKPMVGICRGGQFLNVMSGGTMFQHVNNHAIIGTHPATGKDGEEIEVSSTHHQLMRPSLRGEVLLTANRQTTSRIYWNVEKDCFSEDTHPIADVECVFYEHTNSLCFQPHPEFGSVPQCREWYFEQIEVCFGLSV